MHIENAKYSLKHPSNTMVNTKIADALMNKAPNGRIPCPSAHEIATTLGVLPTEVGVTADLLEYRIIECQMGLFGYLPEKRIAQATPKSQIAQELRAAIEFEVGNKTEAKQVKIISCLSCWHIAEQLNIPRMTVAEACNGLGLKIKPCQIGAF